MLKAGHRNCPVPAFGTYVVVEEGNIVNILCAYSSVIFVKSVRDTLIRYSRLRYHELLVCNMKYIVYAPNYRIYNRDVF